MVPSKKTSTFDAYGFPKATKEEPQKTKEIIGYAIGKSALGLILVATCEFGILAVLSGRTKDESLKRLNESFLNDKPVKGKWDADRALIEVLKLVEDPYYDLTYPVFMQGTEFQKKVWRAVQDVPPGQTATYTEIAQKIRSPRAVRAVGSSCTRCKLSFIVPCHRIVKTGYQVPDQATHKSLLTRRDLLLQREANKALAANHIKKSKKT